MGAGQVSVVLCVVSKILCSYARPQSVSSILAGITGWKELHEVFYTGTLTLRFSLRRAKDDEDASTWLSDGDLEVSFLEFSFLTPDLIDKMRTDCTMLPGAPYNAKQSPTIPGTFRKPHTIKVVSPHVPLHPRHLVVSRPWGSAAWPRR